MLSFFRCPAFLTFLFAMAALGAAEMERLEIGSPPIDMFGDTELGFTPALSCMAWDDKGVLYFGERDGIIRFDGVHWKRLDAIHEDIQALAFDEAGTLYFSHTEGFGFLAPKKDGTYQLIDLLSDSGLTSVPLISRILIAKDRVYFVSVDQVFRYDSRDGRIETIYSPSSFATNPILRNGMLFIADLAHGLMYLDGKDLKIVPGSEDYANENGISSMLVGADGVLRGFTREGNYFQLDSELEESDQRIDPEIARFFERAFQLKDGSFVFVRGNQLHQHAADLSPVRQVDLVVSDFALKASGVELSLSRKDIWAVLGSHALRLNMNSPTTRFSRSHGVDTSIQKVERFQGDLYVNTDQSLLRGVYDERKRLKRFEPAFDRSFAEVALLDITSEGLLLALDGDLMAFDGEEMLSVEELAKKYSLKPYVGPYRVVAQGYDYLEIFHRKNGLWDSHPERIDLGGQVHDVREASDGSIWVELGSGRVARLTYNGSIYRVFDFGQNEGLPDDWVAICELDDETVFVSGSRLYRFNEDEQSFFIDHEYAYIFEAMPGAERIWQDANGRVWGYRVDAIGLIRIDETGAASLDKSPLENLQDIPPNFLTMEIDGKLWFDSQVGLIQCATNKLEQDAPPFDAIISEVKVMGSDRLVHNGVAWNFDEDPYGILPYKDDSLRFFLSAPALERSNGLSFQYRLRGGDAWSSWVSSGVVELLNLNEGEFTFEARAKDYLGRISSVDSFSFKIQTPYYKTIWAYAAYVLVGGLVLGVIFPLYSYRLKKRNAMLEEQIRERTKEVEEQAQALRETLKELHDAQSNLLSSARMAGMAEVATSVLHNVGNVMNSIMVSVNSIAAKFGQSKVTGLGKVTDLMAENSDNLVDFLTQDARGSRLPEYLGSLNEVLLSERDFCLKELESTKAHLAHATTIIASQQKHAKKVDINEEFSLREVVETASGLSVPSRWKKNVTVEIDVADDIYLCLDHHMVLQMLTNFIKNSAESIMDAGVMEGLIQVIARASDDEPLVVVMVKDNGGGVEKEKLGKIFTMGFTTKEYGHGFGLHGVANTVKAMGGSVSIDSEGIGKGATVTLKLPVDGRE